MKLKNAKKIVSESIASTLSEKFQNVDEFVTNSKKSIEKLKAGYITSQSDLDDDLSMSEGIEDLITNGEIHWYECVNHTLIPKSANRDQILSGSITRSPDLLKYYPQLTDKLYTSLSGSQPIMRKDGLDVADYEEYRIEAFAAVSEISRRRSATRLAVLSSLLFHAGNSFGVFEWDTETRKCIGTNRDQASLMCNVAFTLITAFESTLETVNKKARDKETGQWYKPWERAGAFMSRKAVGSAIEWIVDLGILGYDKKTATLTPGVWGTTRCYNYFDIPKLLILAEELERKMGGFEALPDHKSISIKQLHDAVFCGFGYSRTGDADTAAPDTWYMSDLLRDEQRATTASERLRIANLVSAPVLEQGVDKIEDFYGSSVYKETKATLEKMIDDWRHLRSDLGNSNPLVDAAKLAWQAFRQDNLAHLEYA